jgi:hypothetical protein
MLSGLLKDRGIKAVISSKSNRKKKLRHDKACTARNVVAASPGSRIGVASPRDTTSSRRASSPLATSSLILAFWTPAK